MGNISDPHSLNGFVCSEDLNANSDTVYRKTILRYLNYEGRKNFFSKK
jgi:hypothetical protein